LKIVKSTKLIEKVEKRQVQINEMDEDLDGDKDQFGKKPAQHSSFEAVDHSKTIII
jgi:hypothetical protein